METTPNGDTLDFSWLVENGEATNWDELRGSLLYVQEACFGVNHNMGWWQDAASGRDLLEIIHRPHNRVEELLGMALVSQKIMLAVSELGEAMEGHRRNRMDDKLPPSEDARSRNRGCDHPSVRSCGWFGL